MKSVKKTYYIVEAAKDNDIKKLWLALLELKGKLAFELVQKLKVDVFSKKELAKLKKRFGDGKKEES